MTRNQNTQTAPQKVRKQMNDQVKTEQSNEAHISPSELNAGLWAETCVIETVTLDTSTQKKLIRKFVEGELCPCAIETFNEYDNPTIELTMSALYRAVINEMFLRGVATASAETPNA